MSRTTARSFLWFWVFLLVALSFPLQVYAGSPLPSLLPYGLIAIALGLSRGQTNQILNFIDGKRSIPVIRAQVEAWTGEPLFMDRLLEYLGILEEVGWIEIG